MVDQKFGYIGYFDRESCDLNEFKELTSQSLTTDTLRFAAAIEKNVPIYDMKVLANVLSDAETRRDLMAEWAFVLSQSAGVLALRSAFADTSAIDEATDIYNQIIRDERESAGGAGDHFAAAGANDRIWNSLQKLCLAAPDVFVRYFSNPAIAAVCEAWLGPNYQMTAQVNQVRPGGAAQDAHRDYHLGFQSADVAESYPAHMHDLSAALTLQGGIAHADMPLESGPTKLLPFSQLYRSGYVSWRREDFRAYFEEAYVQVPLSKGDAVFFNPALFHAAGANVSTDIQRMANLLQVSSAFGRAMETIDRDAMCRAVYPVLQALDGKLSELELSASIAACAEGYSFPTDLDRDPPVGGLAPETQAALMARALGEGWSTDAFAAMLSEQKMRRTA